MSRAAPHLNFFSDSKSQVTFSFSKVKDFPSQNSVAFRTLVLGLCEKEGADKNNKGPEWGPQVKNSKPLVSLLEQFKKIPSLKGDCESLTILPNLHQKLAGLEDYENFIAFGIGKPKDCYPQKILSMGGKLARELRAQKYTQVEIFLDSLYFPASHPESKEAPLDFAGRSLKSGIPLFEDFVELFLIGISLGLYRFDFYKSKKSETPQSPLEIKLLSVSLDPRNAQNILARSKIIADAAYLVRNLQTTPAADLTPAILAKAAQEAGKKSALSVSVWDEKKLASMGMGGILAVGQGSANPPRFIILEHNKAAKNSGTLVLVGKGITFDSGGHSLKPSNAMEMKMDMSGAAAVLGALYAISLLKLPLRVVGLIPAAENMIDNHAQRIGDIYKAYDGQTVEVLNTDAEGRLILGDALAYAKELNPTCVIDCATLTGAVTMALGSLASGLLGNHVGLIEGFQKASEKIGERCWELPLYPEYGDDMKSKIADYRNIGTNRDAGTAKGATFLNFFVQNAYPWIHLDIAATADTPSGQGSHCPPDVGTGVPTRALIEFARNFKNYFSNSKSSK